MKTPRTDRKLSEAEFFLQQLTKEYERGGRRSGYVSFEHYEEESNKTPPAGPSQAFEYYLSAFLSSARSVTLVLQYEAKETYDAWFPGWIEKLCAGDRELFKFMNEQRVAEIHKLGVQFLMEEKAVSSGQLAGLFEIPPVIGVSEWHLKGPGDKSQDAVGVCERYLTLLVQLLREFRQTATIKRL